jgi:hypothetical protein
MIAYQGQRMPVNNKENLRQILGLAIVVLFLLALVALAKFSPELVLVLIGLLFLYAGIVVAFRQARSVRWFSKWGWIRRVRKIRRAFTAPPLALALYAVCFTLAGLACIALVLTKSPIVFSVINAFCGFTLCLATLVDWHQRLKHMLSTGWVKRLAKLGLVFLATATVFLSLILAKQVTSSIAQVDPAAMPEFVRFLSTLLYPFALAIVVSLTLSIIMLVQYLFLMIGMLFRIPATYLAGLFSFKTRKKLEVLSYRIFYGKRPPIDRTFWDRLMNGSQHIFRPLGTGVIAVAIAFLGQFIIGLAAQVPDRAFKSVLVAVEYRRDHSCDNVSKTSPVAYLQDGYVSVATASLDGVRFSVQKCMR